MKDAPAHTAAIFDVDGTTCATRSTTSLIWLRAQQHSSWQHRLWLASLIWRAPLIWLADKFSRDLADRIIFRQFAGLSQSRLKQDAKTCCAKILLPSCFPEALAEIQLHRQAGRKIILLSGGVDIVLAPLAEALGAELLAQRLDADGDRLTGKYHRYAVLDHAQPFSGNQAESKLAALQRYATSAGIDLAGSFAYGDSINDALMLAAAGNPIAINPDRKLLEIAGHRHWQVRQWHHQSKKLQEHKN